MPIDLEIIAREAQVWNDLCAMRVSVERSPHAEWRAYWEARLSDQLQVYAWLCLVASREWREAGSPVGREPAEERASWEPVIPIYDGY